MDQSSDEALTLDRLPTEVLYYIFDFLPPRVLYFNLRRVCKRFIHLLSRDMYFKVRFRKRYLVHGIEYPLLDCLGLNDQRRWKSGMEVFWADITARTDLREHIFGFNSLFGNVQQVNSLPHTATVDVVKFLHGGRVCVSGGRDRLLCVWDVSNPKSVSGNSSLIAHQPEAHSGWVWDINGYESDAFFTCGWDHNVNYWMLNSDISLIQKFPAERPMCLSSRPGILAAGLQNGKILLMDPRIENTRMPYQHKLHKGTLTGIKILNNNILTIGEDRKMGCIDIRNQQVLMYQHVNCVLKSCPRSLGVYRNLMYVGDSKGYLNIYDMNHDFQPVLSAKVGDDRAINSLYPSIEGVIIGTSDVGLRFIVPSAPVIVLGQDCMPGEVTSVDFKNNVIITGCSNSMCPVHILWPRALLG